MDNDVVATLSYATDEFINELIERAGLDVLSVAAIVLARCSLATEQVGAGEQFRKLMVEVAARPIKTQPTLQ